ncbi:MAG: Lrp/AsnC ligand binding domain-containing protein [Candidatus Tectomicrobia bacterium]|nr:Lrp/AsnC ligand binding domain-containing protein [Candidatus Tectomicrobia bacterium]
MISAFVFIDVDSKKTTDVFSLISVMSGVKSVYAISGPYDLIALVEGDDFFDISNIVVGGIRSIDGVMKTMTCFVLEQS